MVKNFLKKITIFIIAFILKVLFFTFGFLFSLNPFISALLLLTPKMGRVESLIYAFVLGGLSDLFSLLPIGYNGIAFVIVFYLFSLLSSKIVINGLLPFFSLSFIVFALIFFISNLLGFIFEGFVHPSLLVKPFLTGFLSTPFLTIFFYFLEKKISVNLEEDD